MDEIPLRPALIVMLALTLGGYAFGRYEQPAKVVIQEHESVKVVQVEHQVVVTQTKVQKVYLKDKTEHVHREDTVVTHVDGSKEEHKTEDRNTQVKEQQVKFVDRDIYHETVKYQDRVVEKEKLKLVEAKKPDWVLSPMVGVDLGHLSAFKMSLTGPLIYGGEISRRIMGPIYLGAWGLSNASGGLSLSLEF